MHSIARRLPRITTAEFPVLLLAPFYWESKLLTSQRSCWNASGGWVLSCGHIAKSHAICPEEVHARLAWDRYILGTSVASQAVDAFSLSLEVENSFSAVNISWLFSQAVASAGYFKAFLSFLSHPVICVFINQSFVLSFNRHVWKHTILGTGVGTGDPEMNITPTPNSCLHPARSQLGDVTFMRECNKCCGGRIPCWGPQKVKAQDQGKGGGAEMVSEVEESLLKSLRWVSKKKKWGEGAACLRVIWRAFQAGREIDDLNKGQGKFGKS